jgi:hypothetical protein
VSTSSHRRRSTMTGRGGNVIHHNAYELGWTDGGRTGANVEENVHLFRTMIITYIDDDDDDRVPRGYSRTAALTRAFKRVFFFFLNGWQSYIIRIASGVRVRACARRVNSVCVCRSDRDCIIHADKQARACVLCICSTH